MALFHRFCFWFSLRLGAIIIAVIILIEAVTCLVFCTNFLQHQNESSENFKKYLKDLHLFDYESIKKFIGGFYYYVLGSIIFYSILSFSCLLLIVGAYSLSPKLIYPFYIFYGIFIIKWIIFYLFVSRYLVKRGDHDLGLIILYLSVGFFMLLFQSYNWLCVRSLVLVIRDLQREVAKMAKRRIVLTRFEKPAEEAKKNKSKKGAKPKGGTPTLAIVEDRNFSPKKRVVAFHK